jgi:hypothetical protein
MPELTGADPTEDWRSHVECDWTWPNSYGIVGCEVHLVVFLPPSGDDAWPLIALPHVPTWSLT